MLTTLTPPVLTKIELWGELGERFTPEIEGNIANSRDAINFLCCNFPDFKNYILSSTCGYTVTCVGDGWEKSIDPSLADFPISGKRLVIAPAIQGSGGALRILEPILMIGIGIATGNPALIIGGIVSGLQSIFFGYPNKNQTINFQGTGPQTKEGTPIPIAIGSRVKITTPMILSYDIVSEYTPYPFLTL
ncbi:MAG: hypothetical protein V7L23_15330 [Nostoc sp.]|uniref:hypothetical protein n=1 Tax=Nostoc sp. TaxID=1180 RepID=UPI002FF3FC64